MAQQGKQMRVGARKGLSCHSVKMVLLDNSTVTGMSLIRIRFVQVVQPSIH
jgi:hypothetical protein